MDSAPSAFQRLKARARELKRELHALYLACRDPRTPWPARVFALCVVAYAISPIDLIPDFIPVLGYLDELILLPLAIWLVIKLIPAKVLAECREKARTEEGVQSKIAWAGAVAIITLWILGVVLFLRTVGADTWPKPRS